MAQQVRTFRFDAGESISNYNSYGTMTWQLPIVPQSTVDAIIANAALTGSGEKQLIKFDEGPTETYYKMQTGGFNPRAQCRIPMIVQNYTEETVKALADGMWNFWACWSGFFTWPEEIETFSAWKIVLSNAEMRAHNAYYEASVRSPSGMRIILRDPNNWSGQNKDGETIGTLPIGIITTTASGFGGMFFPYCAITETGYMLGSFQTRCERVAQLPQFTAAQFIASPWYATTNLTDFLFPSEAAVESNPGLKDFGSASATTGNLEYNPYNPGGESGTGGFGGDFDNSTDTITVPEAPQWSSPATGFLGIYSPTLEQVQSLASILNSNSIIDSLKNWFASPIDVIMGFAAYPLSIPKTDAMNIKVGWVETEAQAGLVMSQWVVLDCGTIDIKEYWGGFMDYSPYTKISIYLPYCGEYPLDTDDIMGHTLGVKYIIDLLTGVCVASITVDGSVHYQHTGMCKYDMPMTSGGLGNLVNGFMTMLGGAASAATSSTPAASVSAASSIAAGAVTAAKPTVSHTGLVNGNAGLLGVQYPYLIVTRPRQAVATNQGSYVGFPLWSTKTVGECEGFTVYEDIHLEGLPFTSAELSELHDILTTGAIL